MPGNCSRTVGDEDVLVQKKLEEPGQYRVLLYNDDITTMDFVVDILCEIFHKNVEEATEIMLSVHNNGVGQCGVYTLEIAEARVKRVREKAQAAGYPLQCTMEKI